MTPHEFPNAPPIPGSPLPLTGMVIATAGADAPALTPNANGDIATDPAPRRPMQLITQSRLACLRRCPRQHYYRYELGLARDREKAYLRLGSAFHKGLELRGQSLPAADAIGQALAGYETTPPGFDEYEWAVERITVQQLLAGYYWRYENDNLAAIATEQSYELDHRNPETGGLSRTFKRAGKIDVLVTLDDGRLAVHEYKTAGESILPDAPYWLRLRADSQVSTYMLAARAMGHDVRAVIYDVTRKPTIEPRNIPLLDADGLKIVLDANGNRVMTKQGKPRQTGSTEDGYTLQTRPETPEEYGERLLKDIGDRPDYYYARREVPRTDADLEEADLEIWQQSEMLRWHQRTGHWFRNVSAMNCNHCEFNGPCLEGISVSRENPPVGFVALDDVHPEL